MTAPNHLITLSVYRCALVALVLPGHEAGRYARHASATLFPCRGEGLAESAAEYNRGGRRL